MSEDPRHPYVDDRNRDLFAKVTKNYKINLCFFNAPYEGGFSPWQCGINRERKTVEIKYYEKVNTTGYFTHELFHVVMIDKGLMLTDEIMNIVRPIFSAADLFTVNNVNNATAHVKFYNDFLALGYSPPDFFCDYHKDWSKDINDKFEKINNSFDSGKPNDEAINLFISSYFSAVFNINPDKQADCDKQLYALLCKDKTLFDILEKHWRPWFHTTTLDHSLFFKSLFTDINTWYSTLADT